MANAGANATATTKAKAVVLLRLYVQQSQRQPCHRRPTVQHVAKITMAAKVAAVAKVATYTIAVCRKPQRPQQAVDVIVMPKATAARVTTGAGASAGA